MVFLTFVFQIIIILLASMQLRIGSTDVFTEREALLVAFRATLRCSVILGGVFLALGRSVKRFHTKIQRMLSTQYHEWNGGTALKLKKFQKFENSKFQLGWREHLVAVFDQLHFVSHLGCQPLPEITKLLSQLYCWRQKLASKNDPHKFVPSFNLDILSSILVASLYHKCLPWYNC